MKRPIRAPTDKESEMGRWFFGAKKREGGVAKRASKRVERRSGRAKPRSSKTRHRDQPAPLTWNNPDQDFITRAGDPFDG